MTLSNGCVVDPGSPHAVCHVASATRPVNGKLCYAELMAVFSAAMAMHDEAEYLHHETVYVHAQRCDMAKSNTDAR